jgi:UDP-N-acetylmuramoyl-L-alanyl-D-glutamate--2,6-diaminopimelate ligase
MPLPELLQNDNMILGNTLVTGMQLDSRNVSPGDLFLAMPGDVHDGRQFIEQAVANGASAVLAEAPVAGFIDEISVPLVELPELRLEAGSLAARFYRNPSRHMHIVGITGTNGKTTTSRIFAQLARALGKPCGVIGTLGATLGNDIGEAANTTPDSISLQRQLAEWHAAGVPSVCMEVSSHALVQGRVNGVEFETALYTNLSHDHMDYHGSMAAYAQAKMRLFSFEGLQHAVLNVDDEMAALIAASVNESADVITYSATGQSADLRIVEPRFHAGGVEATLLSPWGSGDFHSPLAGQFNLANVAAAVAALVLAGEDLISVLAAIRHLQPVSGRMQSVSNDLGIQAIVDYAHTPDALEQVLLSLRPHVEGSIITVFGCGGDRDKEKRQIMGRIASRYSDEVIVTTDNPRSEEPARIIADIEAGCTGNYSSEVDRGRAIIAAVERSVPGDCVLVAGKGHEDYQLVEGEKLYFSDVEQLQAAFAGGAGQ